MGKRNTFATYLFSSTSLEDLSRRMSYVERFADRYKEVANTAKQQQRELVAMQHSMNIRQQELDSIRASLKGEQQALQVDKRQAQSALNKLSQQERDELKKKKRQEEEYKKANAQLEKILAENTVGSNFSSNTRGLKLPIEGGRIRPLQKNMAEISGPRGATVRCVEAGTVGEISEASGGHYIIKVAHGKDFYTVYTHVTNVCVKVGQKVKENQKIGAAGLFVDYDGTQRSFIQFMVYNHRTGEMEEVMKFFSPK
jgi:murein DD-endopeptidase MepM/ murein hydrolase activator NlpD